MGKTKEVVEKVKRKAPYVRNDVLKVSKSVKMLQAATEIRGGDGGAVVRIMGEAEANFKLNGRLVLSGND